MLKNKKGNNFKEQKVIYIKFLNVNIRYKIFFLYLLLIIIFIFNHFYIRYYLLLKSRKFYKARIKYLKKYNRKYKESNLKTFEDKLNWLLIHDTNKLKGKCADKILLHKYSYFKIGKDICNKILKIYDNIEQININELPNKFVLKTNHGSGFNFIVNNKSQFNFSTAKEILKDWMNIDYGKWQAEFHYSFINKKIFVEEFIGKTLKNYKILCYNGNPKYIYVSIKEGNNKYRNFYDINWNFLNFSCMTKPHPTYKYPKPKLFELMKTYAKKLSKDFKFVRVDLYELENEVRLGELTFIPMNSFFWCKNKSNEIELGKDIII